MMFCNQTTIMALAQVAQRHCAQHAEILARKRKIEHPEIFSLNKMELKL